jgi:glyoxylase-like metal-dependent hydrolase (beta-lactamase superfamily II)
VQVVQGVHQVDGLKGGPTLVLDDDAVTLVDTSYPGSEEAIFACMAALGRRPEELRQILVTHSDHDHAGCVAGLVEATGATVYAHAGEVEVIEGRREAKNGLMLERPAKVDRTVSDGDRLPFHGGIQVIGTPGHTPGHVCYLLPAENLVIAGDALNANDAASVFGASPQFTYDVAQAKESVRRLAELAPDSLCFGHGLPVVGNAAEALRLLVASL